MAWSWKRKVAVGLLGVPPLAFLPFRYWAFHRAGGWFVSLDLEPEHRAAHIGEMVLFNFVALSIVLAFASSLLLCLDGFHPRITAIVASMLMIPALLGLAFFGIGLQTYLRSP